MGLRPGAWLAVHSVIMIAASPIFTMVGAWPLAFVSLVPCVVAALALKDAPRKAFVVAALGLIPWWFVTHAWLINVTVAGFFAVPFILSTFDAFAIFLTARLARNHRTLALSAFPVFWTGLNYVRGEIAFDGYAWGWASHPLIDARVVAAPACVIGGYGVTFLVAAFAAALVYAKQHTRNRRFLAPIGVGAAWALLSWFGVSQFSPSVPSIAAPVRFAIVQTNVPQDNKLDWTIEQENRDFDRFRDLTLKAMEPQVGPDVVVWPETMAPGMTLAPQALKALSENDIFVRHEDGSRQWATAFADSMLDLSATIKVPLIVGDSFIDNLSIHLTPDGKPVLDSDARYNAAFVLREGKIERQWYFKIHLTPFGEVMPYISSWPWLERQLLSIGAKGMTFDLAAGTEPTVLTVPATDGRTIRCVTPICFESTDSRLLRRLVFDKGIRRCDVIVNLTNDGWFTFSNLTRRQHLQAARWRSLETLTPTIRAANTGVSALISFDGSLIASGVDDRSGASDIDGLLTGEVSPTSKVPPFATIGNSLPLLCAAASGLSLLLHIGRSIRRKPTRT